MLETHDALVLESWGLGVSWFRVWEARARPSMTLFCTYYISLLLHCIALQYVKCMHNTTLRMQWFIVKYGVGLSGKLTQNNY